MTGSSQPGSDIPDTPTDKSCFPMRFQIATMLFISITFSLMLRSSMSMNILAMVDTAPATEKPPDNRTALPDFGPRYNWSLFQQSILLGAGFGGSVCIIIPFGILTDRFGHVRQTLLAGAIVSAALQFASPLAAATSFGAFVAIVVVGGVAQGGAIIAAHKMFTTWAPPSELGVFTSVIMGTNLGTVASWTISGALIETAGWPYSFYFNGALTCLFALAWWYIVYDSPAQHPRIAAAERKFIEQSLAQHSQHSSSWPPIWAIITSIPAWCLLLLQFGNLWGLFFLLTASPKFINEILGFQLAGTGVLASIPYLARWFSSIGWAWLGKEMGAKSGWSLLNQRKFFTIFSHFLPGLCFIALPYVSSTPYACIALIAVSQALNGCAPQSTFATFHDIAPNFAVTMVSIINTIGSLSGVIAPLMVAQMTCDRNTIAEWQMIFMFGACGYIVPGLVFAVAGNASVQPWDTGIAEKRTVDAAESTVSVEGRQHVAVADDRCVRGVRISALHEF